jgi:hypothetical protein
MANADLEYLEEVFLKVRRTKRFTKSFTVIRDAAHHCAVNENSSSVSVGTKSSVSEPPGT